MQGKLVDRLIVLFHNYVNLKLVVTHNQWGEYGHIDHRNLHMAVMQAFHTVYSDTGPLLKVFFPDIDYGNMIDRLSSPKSKCDETLIHKSLLDSYERDGSLKNAHLFRTLCYSFIEPTKSKYVEKKTPVFDFSSLKRQ